MPRWTRILSVLLILALTGCAAWTPQPTGRLASRFIIDNGRGEVSGRVLAPTSLISNNSSSYRLQETDGWVEQAVRQAVIEVVDARGNVIPDVLPVQTNDLGRFKIRDLPLGEACFLRVKFAGKSGRIFYLYAYVRPETRFTCMEVSLPSSIIAEKIAKDEALVPVYDPEKVADLVERVREELMNLPVTSEPQPDPDPSADPGSPPPTPPITLEQVIETIVTKPQPDVPASTPAAPVFDQLIETAPDIAEDLAEAIETYLLVTVTVQGFGSNAAPFPGRNDQRHLMVGDVELAVTTAQQAEGVVFALNGEALSTASAEPDAWRGILHTRNVQDGDYLLTANTRDADGKPGKVLAKAFVRIQNRTPDDTPCEGKWQDGL